MNTQPVVLKIVGFFYFLLHAAMLFFAATYAFMDLTIAPRGGDGILILMIPLLGLSAGYFIRHGKFGLWRVLLIILSVLLSSGLILMNFFVPAIQKKPTPTEQPSVVSPGTRLIEAVRNDQPEEVRRLLNQGVSIKAKNEFGESVLHVVKDPAMARFLVDRGADVQALEDMDGMTPLFMQDVAVAKLLVDAGANVNARSKKGNTPLIWHTYSNYPEGIRFLVSKGANINAVNSEESTALDIAERFGERGLADFLRSLGAKTAEEIARQKELLQKIP
jgi:hypothetical protein